MPGMIAPMPPARETIRGVAWKSLPRPGSKLVSAKELQGDTNSRRPMRTSRRRIPNSLCPVPLY